MKSMAFLGVLLLASAAFAVQICYFATEVNRNVCMTQTNPSEWRTRIIYGLEKIENGNKPLPANITMAEIIKIRKDLENIMSCEQSREKDWQTYCKIIGIDCDSVKETEKNAILEHLKNSKESNQKLKDC